MTAARARADLTRELHRHRARLVAGLDDDESEEAEAGAILEAEAAHESHEVHGVVMAWYEANRKR